MIPLPKAASKLEDTLQFQIRVSKLAAPEREYRFAPPRKWSADFAWPDHHLLVEIQGGQHVRGRHNRPEGYDTDCEKHNAAVELGWRVLTFTGAMVEDGRAVATIERILRCCYKNPNAAQYLSGRRKPITATNGTIVGYES